jgi:glyoxylase-like metal-dependent hydrolase (beta-lactamase superfamily II)
MVEPRILGDFHVWCLSEWQGPTNPLHTLLSASTLDLIDANRDWLQPYFMQPDNVVIMGTQSFIIRTPDHTILIDGCIGNDKPRQEEYWNNQQTPYLANMGKLGFSPEDFDIVIVTHMHIDHVGWCTRLVDGQWVPTFPNARHVYVCDEWDYWQNCRTDTGGYVDCVADSVLPVIEAGKADFVEHNTVIAEGIRLEALAGHTPGHTGVHLESGGLELVIGGDLMHHPIQAAAPDLTTGYDVNPQQATQARHAFLERYADTGTLVGCVHFASPVFGRITRQSGFFRFEAVS